MREGDIRVDHTVSWVNRKGDVVQQVNQVERGGAITGDVEEGLVRICEGTEMCSRICALWSAVKELVREDFARFKEQGEVNLKGWCDISFKGGGLPIVTIKAEGKIFLSRGKEGSCTVKKRVTYQGVCPAAFVVEQDLDGNFPRFTERSIVLEENGEVVEEVREA